MNNLAVGYTSKAMKNTHAKKLGSITSEKKAVASRENGKLGGRRRKFRQGERIRMKGEAKLISGWNGTGTVIEDEDFSGVIAIAKDGEDPSGIGFIPTLIAENELVRVRDDNAGHHPGQVWVCADFIVSTLLHNLNFSGMNSMMIVDFVRQFGSAIRVRVSEDAGGIRSLMVLNSDVVRYYRHRSIEYNIKQPKFERPEAIQWPYELR